MVDMTAVIILVSLGLLFAVGVRSTAKLLTRNTLDGLRLAADLGFCASEDRELIDSASAAVTALNRTLSQQRVNRASKAIARQAISSLVRALTHVRQTANQLEEMRQLLDDYTNQIQEATQEAASAAVAPSGVRLAYGSSAKLLEAQRQTLSETILDMASQLAAARCGAAELIHELTLAEERLRVDAKQTDFYENLLQLQNKALKLFEHVATTADTTWRSKKKPPQ